jgi:tetratricopeptide (TPR) repeat protein
VNPPSPPDERSLPLADELLVDELCTEFEDAWRSGRHPEIETFLNRAPASTWQVLLRELIWLDYHYHCQNHQTFPLEAYRARFPAMNPQWLEARDTPPDAAGCSALSRKYGSTTPGLATTPTKLRLGRSMDDFDLLEEIAHGGMGAVHRGRDNLLGRELAVKILRPELHSSPAAANRFLAEARCNAQLQHPGVVPVHELGELPDGRPFFTMKLVQGRTLAELLQERPTPAHDLPRFLRTFEQVCQAVAYAHSRRVIHRDLKPANVMVGEFGEVQVMDWGLAKVLAGPEPAGSQSGTETPIPVRAQPNEPTEHGVAIGTWAYMPPEQADGRLDEVDERSDVFGLGAILCEILTGSAPYPSRPRNPLRGMPDRELADAHARLHDCGADSELIRMATRYLAANRGDRPRDAAEVARNVAGYLAGVQERLQQERLQRQREQVEAAETRKRLALEAAEDRRRRKLRLALVASVLGLVVVAGGAMGWWKYQRLLQRREVERALDQTLTAMGKSDFPAARESLEQARGRLGSHGPEDLQDRLQRAQNSIDLVTELNRVRRRRVTWIGNDFDTDLALRGYQAAFEGAALNIWDESATAEEIRDSPIRAELLAAVDDWAWMAHQRKQFALQKQLLAVARQVDPDPQFRDRLRDPSIWNSREAVRQLASEATQARLTPRELGMLATLLMAVKENAEGLLREAQAQAPNDYWVNFRIGQELKRQRRFGEAIEFYRAALAVEPDSYAALTNIAVALGERGDWKGAARASREAIRHQPNWPEAHANLGLALARQGHLDDAVGTLEQAIRLNEDYPIGHINLGQVLYLKRDFEGSQQAYERALKLSPGDARLHASRGLTLFGKGKFDDAVRAFEEAVRLDPADAAAHNYLGLGLRRIGQSDRAIQVYRKAIALDPGLADAHFHLGNVLATQQEWDEAIRAYRETIRLDPRFVEAHVNLGNALKRKGDAESAIQAYRNAIQIGPGFPTGHMNLGTILLATGDVEGAAHALQEAIRLNPKDEAAYGNLGSALRRLGEYDRAVQALREAIRLQPRSPAPQCELGRVFRDQGKLEESLAMMKRGHELATRLPSWPEPTGQWVRDAERLAELSRRLPGVLTGDSHPADPAERLEFAAFCVRYKKHYAAAFRLYAEAFEAQPKLAEDLVSQHRYRAACAAAAASADAIDGLTGEQRAVYRKQALTWLHEDLVAARDLLSRAFLDRAALARKLQDWQKQPELAAVRTPEALRTLPVRERQEWEQLWRDVVELARQLAMN